MSFGSGSELSKPFDFVANEYLTRLTMSLNRHLKENDHEMTEGQNALFISLGATSVGGWIDPSLHGDYSRLRAWMVPDPETIRMAKGLV